MDYSTFIETITAYLKNNGNLHFVIYALFVCLLTQVTKKIIVDKVKVNLLHTFDLSVILPFVFAFVFSVFHTFVINKATEFQMEYLWSWAVDSATIGALASVTFKFISSLSGENLKSLLSNDVFAIFYSQMTYFGDMREKLLSKTITWQEFVSEIKLVCSSSKKIYTDSASTPNEKREKLKTLLLGIIDETTINATLDSVHTALMDYYSKTTNQ